MATSPRLFITKALHCGVYANVPERTHYDIRFSCQLSGLFYCHSHRHLDICCKTLPMEFWQENEEAAKAIDKSMPQCSFCKRRYPANERAQHMRACIDDYIKMQKAVSSASSTFVPERNVTYNMRDEIPFRQRSFYFRKPLREVIFVEER